MNLRQSKIKTAQWENTGKNENAHKLLNDVMIILFFIIDR